MCAAVDARCSRRDAGQATPLLVVLIALMAVAGVALAELGGAAVAATRAQTAADAAALAGAAEGEAAARAVAAANGGELVAHRRDGAVVAVEVRLGGARATARAEVVGGGATGGDGPVGGGDRAGLAPAMVAALARADTLLGRPVPVVSGLRTRAEQEALWANRHRNPYPVARPGTSAHERGTAVDVARGVVAALLAVAPAAGLCQPLPRTDPVHFVTCPSTDPA